MHHTFHIPVLGLGFSIDTPLKVARYGIASVVSIVDDELAERMRRYHLEKNNLAYLPIHKNEHDSRARRITAYLNMLERMVQHQFTQLRHETFAPGSDLTRYLELLPHTSPLRQQYEKMLAEPDNIEKLLLQTELRNSLTPGAIDVNVMSKVDKLNYDQHGGYLGDENTDALAALRGFATSRLHSSLILSAGMNPRLYSYIETFTDFYPDHHGTLRKKITLKVSDYRSGYIQAKFLAKKGLWVSEFRVESGLNCGGHAFATDGLLLGPILEEFKNKRAVMYDELLHLYNHALAAKGIISSADPEQRITVQGGIGTAREDAFLRDYYHLNGTGWGSPFLLVPEATNVDQETLHAISLAGEDDFYLSNASPLGIPFNNFSGSSMEKQRQGRIEKGRPGSPCTKKYLCSNTEFTEQPICTASREYQRHKIEALQLSGLNNAEYQKAFEAITEKVCLCEGLCSSAYIKNDMLKARESKAVAICPGPNLAWFSGSYSLNDMVGHIYGRNDLLAGTNRPHVFINELRLYIDYLEKEINNYLQNISEKKKKWITSFKEQLKEGIDYYKNLIPAAWNEPMEVVEDMMTDLLSCRSRLEGLFVS